MPSSAAADRSCEPIAAQRHIEADPSLSLCFARPVTSAMLLSHRSVNTLVAPCNRCDLKRRKSVGRRNSLLSASSFLLSSSRPRRRRRRRLDGFAASGRLAACLPLASLPMTAKTCDVLLTHNLQYHCNGSRKLRRKREKEERARRK